MARFQGRVLSPLEHCSKSLELHLVAGIGNLLHIRLCVSTVLFRFMLAIVVVFGGAYGIFGVCLLVRVHQEWWVFKMMTDTWLQSPSFLLLGMMSGASIGYSSHQEGQNCEPKASPFPVSIWCFVKLAGKVTTQ